MVAGLDGDAHTLRSLEPAHGQRREEERQREAAQAGQRHGHVKVPRLVPDGLVARGNDEREDDEGYAGEVAEECAPRLVVD